MVLNTKFWSFPVHTYQKQSFLMIILAMRGQGKNLVIDKNSIIKKWKFENFYQNICYIHQNKSEIQIQIEKVWFVTKKMEKIYFEIFFFKGGTLWCRNGRNFFFSVFQNFKNFFEKWPQWDITNVERNKVMKFELHQTVLWGVTRDIPPGAGPLDPPRVE